MKVTEENFISLIRQRREKGILYVMETYGGLLRSIVKKHLSMAPEYVEECMNDIFMGIWQHIDSFDPDRGKFVNWAAGVTRLEAIDTLRRLQREHARIPLSPEEAGQALGISRNNVYVRLSRGKKKIRGSMTE